MRGVILVIVQLVVSLFVVGAILPAVLFTVPATRGPRTGLLLTGVLLVGAFVGLRLVWRSPRRE